MKFKVRLLFTYSLVVMILIILSGAIFISISFSHMKQIAYQELHILAKSISGQMDETIRSMIFMTEFLLSDSKTLSAINSLGRIERLDTRLRHIGEAKRDLRASLMTYVTETNYHRIVYFNPLGDIISSNSKLNVINDGSSDLSQLTYLSLINTAEGGPVLLPPYMDPWDPQEPQMVFGIARLIIGNNIPSYLEVQKPYALLENFYHPDDSRAILFGIANSRGEIFFSQFSGDEEDSLLKILNENKGQRNDDLSYRIRGENLMVANEQDKFSFQIGSGIVVVQYSPYSDTYTAVIRTGKSMTESFAYIAWVTIGLCLLVWIISVGVIYILSLRMTTPIARLVARMESTSLDNISSDVKPEKTNDEFVKLYQAYNQLLTRLSNSIEQEKQMSLLHLQAEFNTLQAQVNPHFLYNVLNVLSHRGVVNRDEVICRICEELAAMMRYTAEVSSRLVTVQDELDYVKHYLYLLKTRYQNKLNYTIEFDSELSELMIPKMVIQPLVENSVNHGFRDKTDIMNINIRCRKQEDKWYIVVADNGTGFSGETLLKVEQKMKEIRLQVINGNRNLNIDSGGIGLINIYARLFIIYGDSTIFKIECPEKGAIITIGATGRVENV